MKTLQIFPAIVLGALLIIHSSAAQDKFDPDLKIGFQASGAMQTLDDKISDNSFSDIPTGFQNATGNQLNMASSLSCTWAGLVCGL